MIATKLIPTVVPSAAAAHVVSNSCESAGLRASNSVVIAYATSLSRVLMKATRIRRLRAFTSILLRLHWSP